MLFVHHHDHVKPTAYMCHTRTRYVPFVVITIPSFPISWFTTGLLTAVIWRLPPVAKVQLICSEHMNSPRGFCLLRFAQSLVFYVKIVFLSFFFPRPLYCLSLFDLYFWLRLWYFQTLLEFEHRNGYINIHWKGKECTVIYYQVR